MLKKMLLGAFAVVSVSAMAQDGWRDDNRSSIDANGKTSFEIKREVCRMDQYLSGSGGYDFECLLNRVNGNVEDAMVSGLFAAHRQAVLIRDQMIASQLPVDATVIIDSPATDNASVMAEETETSMRPMKMVIQNGHPSWDIDYDMAYDIITTDLSSTQRTELSKWWDNPTNDHGKDLICQMLMLDAQRAKEPVYLSLYMHHMYPITPIN